MTPAAKESLLLIKSKHALTFYDRALGQ
jgi:hypothetical protein